MSPHQSNAKKTPLWIEASMGLAGDMFSCALIALGAPQDRVVFAMHTAADLLGGAAIEVSSPVLADGAPARQITVKAPSRGPLAIADAPTLLEQALRAVGVLGGYAGFAHRALAILCTAERAAHGIDARSALDATTASLRIIGVARTPFQDQAPYQPSSGSSDSDHSFFLEIQPEFAAGLIGLESFSHLFVVSHLQRSPGYGVSLTPPWKNDSERIGVFATRSPNRPAAIGLSRVRLRRIQGTRVFTDPLDLFDRTPIIDIKPYIHTLDSAPNDAASPTEAGNDGWLVDTEHLELHQRGVPHNHPGGGQLHEAQDILVDLVGAAFALQLLDVDLDNIFCVSPVRVGGGTVHIPSHGRLSVPTPATRAILHQHGIPHEAGPVRAELLTPTGAAILAALSPTFIPQVPISAELTRVGAGLGTKRFKRRQPNALRIYQIIS